jgi:hypothetical protein
MRAPVATRTAVLVESEAVCASGKISAGPQQNQAFIGGGNASALDAQASCESGLALTGGGFANFPDGEQPSSFITSDYPLMNGATAVWDIGWQSPPATEVTMTVWAICGYSY